MNKTVVPLTTPPKKKLHIGIKIGIVFAISFLLFIIRTILIFTGWDGASLVGALLGIALPILVIIIGIPLVLILHFCTK